MVPMGTLEWINGFVTIKPLFVTITPKPSSSQCFIRVFIVTFYQLLLHLAPGGGGRKARFYNGFAAVPTVPMRVPLPGAVY